MKYKVYSTRTPPQKEFVKDGNYYTVEEIWRMFNTPKHHTAKACDA